MPNYLFESFAESLSDQSYLLAIVALMPMVGGLLVFQTSPYQALVLRGILGAIAALVYALFGAADVALTEALVGTMLSMTLYVVAIFSSQKLGHIKPASVPGIRTSFGASFGASVGANIWPVIKPVT